MHLESSLIELLSSPIKELSNSINELSYWIRELFIELERSPIKFESYFMERQINLNSIN